jgi:transposase
MKAYSLDLRQRVLSAALRGDRTIPEVAELFGVSMTLSTSCFGCTGREMT